jgi:hypothetical protein
MSVRYDLDTKAKAIWLVREVDRQELVSEHHSIPAR